MAIDTNDIMESVTNPIKNRILMILKQQGECTAKVMLAELSDIPQATMYRMLNRMVESKVIVIVRENQIRAVTEKVYAINEEFYQVGEDVAKDNDGQAYCRMFAGFTLGLMSEFQEYAKRPDINILKDGSGFSAANIYATAAELNQLGQQIAELVRPYLQPDQAVKGQQSHLLATIITPPKEKK